LVILRRRNRIRIIPRSVLATANEIRSAALVLLHCYGCIRGGRGASGLARSAARGFLVGARAIPAALGGHLGNAGLGVSRQNLEAWTRCVYYHRQHHCDLLDAAIRRGQLVVLDRGEHGFSYPLRQPKAALGHRPVCVVHPAFLGGMVQLDMRPFRIAIAGVESTGKSTLAVALGSTLNAQVVEELARTDADVMADRVNLETLGRLSAEQLAACDSAEKIAARKGAGVIITDTDDIVLAVWGKAVFGQIPNGLDAWHGWADLTLLCAPNIPWQPDPLRSTPHLVERLKLHDAYLKHMAHRTRWTLIDGASKAERLDQAVRAFHACISH
jgi:nicotinamide riboside kinase